MQKACDTCEYFEACDFSTFHHSLGMHNNCFIILCAVSIIMDMQCEHAGVKPALNLCAVSTVMEM
jgi:hypothetical protein